MLYYDVLLEAAKSASLVDDIVDGLEPLETKQIFGYLKNAIAKFNNNVNVSIGTEKLIVNRWHSDGLGHFARIVRGHRNDLELFDDGNENNVSRIKWNGIDGRSMQELPQRLISATGRAGAGVPALWTIVNEKDFFEASPNERIVCYCVQENDAIVRARHPATMLLLFDRAILFPWEESDLQKQIMIPTSHIPFLINLVALEIANGLKMESDLITQLKDQIASQEEDLLRNNVRDRVKLNYTSRGNAFNAWYRVRGV
jgi:hypothetical protein